jgi:hypothetical protein
MFFPARLLDTLRVGVTNHSHWWHDKRWLHSRRGSTWDMKLAGGVASRLQTLLRALLCWAQRTFQNWWLPAHIKSGAPMPRNSTTSPTTPGQPRHAGQVFIYAQSCQSDLYLQKDLLLGHGSWFRHVRHQRTNTTKTTKLWWKIWDILLRRDFYRSAIS